MLKAIRKWFEDRAERGAHQHRSDGHAHAARRILLTHGDPLEVKILEIESRDSDDFSKGIAVALEHYESLLRNKQARLWRRRGTNVQ